VTSTLAIKARLDPNRSIDPQSIGKPKPSQLAIIIPITSRKQKQYSATRLCLSSFARLGLSSHAIQQSARVHFQGLDRKVMSPGHSTLAGSKRIPPLTNFLIGRTADMYFWVLLLFPFPFAFPIASLPVDKIIGIKSQEAICATPCFEPVQEIAAKRSVARFEQLMKQTRPDQQTGLGLPEHHRAFRHPSQALNTLSAKPCVCQSPSPFAHRRTDALPSSAGKRICAPELRPAHCTAHSSRSSGTSGSILNRFLGLYARDISTDNSFLEL
jgi:hypothetical protein